MRLTLKHFSKALNHPRLNVRERRVASEPFKRSHAAVRDAARNDEIEVPQVCGDIEGETVAGNPAGDADANGGELFVADPDTGEALNATGRNPIVFRDANEDFLQITHVAVHVQTIGMQIENRIADELSRTVIRDVAAAPGFEDVDAGRLQRIGRGTHVRPPTVASDAERQHARMFDQEQKVVDVAGATLLDERPLQRERLLIGDDTESANLKLPQDPSSPACV